MTDSIERAERLISEWPDTRISGETRRVLIDLVDNLLAERARSHQLLLDNTHLRAVLDAIGDSRVLRLWIQVLRDEYDVELSILEHLDSIVAAVEVPR
jgi:hypothetical protein